MTQALQVFEFKGSKVRTAGTFEAPLFCAADACAVLDIANVSDAIGRLRQTDVESIASTDVQGKNRQIAYVTEGGLNVQPGAEGARDRSGSDRDFLREDRDQLEPMARLHGHAIPKRTAPTLDHHPDQAPSKKGRAPVMSKAPHPHTPLRLVSTNPENQRTFAELAASASTPWEEARAKGAELDRLTAERVGRFHRELARFDEERREIAQTQRLYLRSWRGAVWAWVWGDQ